MSTARPILMSAPMVRALDGRKTQTRRIVKQQPPNGWDRHCWYAAPVYGWTSEPEPAATWHKVRCPYGVPGDLLWVRERFAHVAGETLYAADCTEAEREEERKLRREFPGLAAAYPDGRWKPSIHMPRSLSRITLRITDVRVERLQDISDADAIAEGCPAVSLYDLDCDSTPPARHFRSLWESINGPGSWDANPWVWVVEFDVLRRNVDACGRRGSSWRKRK